LAWAKIKQFF